MTTLSNSMKKEDIFVVFLISLGLQKIYKEAVWIFLLNANQTNQRCLKRMTFSKASENTIMATF